MAFGLWDGLAPEGAAGIRQRSMQAVLMPDLMVKVPTGERRLGVVSQVIVTGRLLASLGPRRARVGQVIVGESRTNLWCGTKVEPWAISTLVL